MNGISKLLSTDGFIPVNKTLIKKLGLHEAIILGELCSEYNYWEQQGKLEDDMFYSTRDNIEENTGLNDHYQRKAISTLKDSGILSVERKGIPAVNYYKIDFDKILTLLSTRCESREHLEINLVNLNNNKQTKIKEQKNNSKELLQNSPSFEFGKQKPQKENLFTKCVNLIDDFTVDTQVRIDLTQYLNVLLEMRKDGYTLYANMWKGLLKKLGELSKNPKEQHEIIWQSIERGYKSFFPVNSYSNNLKDKPWEKGVKSEGYTEEEKRQIEKEHEEMEARGERVWY